MIRLAVQPSGGLRRAICALRIVAKSKPGRAGDEGVCRGAIDLACGGNVGHDRSFHSKNVDQRKLGQRKLGR
jgi:hypothetical protein